MRVQLSTDLIGDLKKLKHRDRKLADQVQKQLTLFKLSPKHPSLRTHKLTGNLSNRWSISITGSVRMTYVVLDNDVAYFMAIGTHDKIYRH